MAAWFGVEDLWTYAMGEDPSEGKEVIEGAADEDRPRRLSAEEVCDLALAGFEHRGPDGVWSAYSATECALIAAHYGKASGGAGSVQLPDGPFEIRFGSAAVSSKMPQVPSTKMVQVNLKNDNTRLVRPRPTDEMTPRASEVERTKFRRQLTSDMRASSSMDLARLAEEMNGADAEGGGGGDRRSSADSQESLAKLSELTALLKLKKMTAKQASRSKLLMREITQDGVSMDAMLGANLGGPSGSGGGGGGGSGGSGMGDAADRASSPPPASTKAQLAKDRARKVYDMVMTSVSEEVTEYLMTNLPGQVLGDMAGSGENANWSVTGVRLGDEVRVGTVAVAIVPGMMQIDVRGLHVTVPDVAWTFSTSTFPQMSDTGECESDMPGRRDLARWRTTIGACS